MTTPSEYRAVWKTKPVLRVLYTAWYEKIAAARRGGRSLEIGGGSGNFKEFADNVVSSDILFADWLDVACDAQRLPFADGSFDDIVMFDVLHHVERPPLFLREAARVLRPGGRIVMMEPGVTPISGLFFKMFHDEPVDMGADPYLVGPVDPEKDPFDANQAIPTLLFQGRARQAKFETAFPELRIDVVERLGCLAYPLSGGFRPWSAVPAGCVGALTAVENLLGPLLKPLMAFRLFVVLEKQN
ncbi:MAG: SAM-dependent methyltransferase [Alphaproteobacteria bacterium]